MFVANDAEPIATSQIVAAVPEVSGIACYTGRHEFWFDPVDPLHRGFIFR
jgi:proline racemase